MSVSVEIPIKVQKRSGFDKSHHNALNQNVGTIVPILVDEVIPDTKVFLRYAMAGSLPPLATDTYMKCYYDVRAFFVPFRLLYGGFESFFTDYAYKAVGSSGGSNPLLDVKGAVPYFSIDKDADLSQILGRGSLADFLGYKLDDATWASQDKSIEITTLPFVAYHKVCSDWFRQPNVTVPYFAKPSSVVTDNRPTAAHFMAMMPFLTLPSGSEVVNVVTDLTDANLALADGISIFQLRQANYDYDYFTNALPNAQLGSDLSVSTSGNTFTIAQLRYANSLQQFAEMNQLGSSDYVSAIKTRYGAGLGAGLAQKCLYLGGARIDIASKSVEVNAAANNSRNPFVGQVGATAGRAFCQGTDIIIDDFVAKEPGYIFVVGVVVPKATYASGIRRYLRHYIGAGSIVDMANPLLQNVGNQPIYQYELSNSLGIAAEENLIFGFTDRYGEFMGMEDEVHNSMIAGGSLGSFVAQREFQGTNPVIGSNFLTIPVSALNNITAVVAQIGSYGFYGQFAFDYKVSMPLAQYSLPSLQNPAYEHGKTVMVHRGGFRF